MKCRNVSGALAAVWNKKLRGFLMKKNIKWVLIISALLLSFSISGFASDITVKERKQELQEMDELFSEGNRQEVLLTEKLDLDDYIRIGLSRNPGLRSAFYDWKAAFQKISVASSLPDPQVSYTDYLESVETRVGPQERAYSISQKIPLPDKLWIRKDRQFRASEEVFFRFQKKKLDLVYRITDVYYEYAYLYKSIKLTEENIQLLKSVESAMQSRYASGLVRNQDVLKIQVEIEKLRNDLQSLKSMRVPLMSRLKALLDVSESAELSWPDESFDITGLSADASTEHEALFHQLKEDNPELKSLDANIEKNRKTVTLARREYFPDLTVGLSKIDTGPALNPAVIDSGKDPVMLKFTFNVPLWFGRNEARIGAARSLLESAEDKRSSRERELASMLFLIRYKLEDALRQAELYKVSLIPKAEQTVEAVQASYEAGHSDFLSFIDAQRMLLQFQLAYYRFSSTAFQKAAEMKFFLGEEAVK